MTATEQQVASSQLDEECLDYTGASREELKQAQAQTKLYVHVQNLQENPPKPKPSTLRKEICQAFSIPEEVMFIHTRKKEIVNARQIYVYLLVTTDVKKKIIKESIFRNWQSPDPDMGGRDRPTVLMKHIGFDHATIYHCCRVTMNYYATERFYQDLINRLRIDLFAGKIDMPNVKIPAA